MQWCILNLCLNSNKVVTCQLPNAGEKFFNLTGILLDTSSVIHARYTMYNNTISWKYEKINKFQQIVLLHLMYQTVFSTYWKNSPMELSLLIYSYYSCLIHAKSIAHLSVSPWKFKLLYIFIGSWMVIFC